MTDTSSKKMHSSPMLHLFRLLENLSVWVVPLLLFAGVLSLPLPKEVWEEARYGFWGIGIAIVLLYYFTFRANRGDSALGHALSLSALLVTFALPLARLWHTGASESYVVGGLLPMSDAAGYYGDAQNILLGSSIGAWSPQRPLFSGLLASLLALTHQNLQASLALLVVINAIACWFAAREVQKTHGALVAAMLSMQGFFFYRLFIGKAMTENLGLAVGLLGFAVLWRSAHSKHPWTGLFGVFLLAFALNARMGTVFVLPAVILWGAYWFRRSGRFSGLFLVGGFGAVFFASLLNLILLKQVGIHNGSPPFANFSYVLYGIVTHSNWMQVTIDHPEITKLGSTERFRAILEVTIIAIRQHPWGLVTGLFRGWQDFFWGGYSLYSWLSPASIPLDLVLRPLAIFVVWGCLRNWKTPGASLLLAMAIGAFLTIPLLPMVDAGIRPYAVTVVILYMFSALGLLLLLKDILQPLFRRLLKGELKEKRGGVDPTQPNQAAKSVTACRTVPRDMLIFGMLICLLSVVGPISLKQLAAPPAIPASFICPPRQEVRRYQINRGSGINLVGNRKIDHSNLPNIRIRDFRKGLQFFKESPEYLRLLQLPPATAILATYWGWLVADRQLVPPKLGFVAVCGQMQRVGQDLAIFQATVIQPLPIKTP